jgi:hypothetical protein
MPNKHAQNTSLSMTHHRLECLNEAYAVMQARSVFPDGRFGVYVELLPGIVREPSEPHKGSSHNDNPPRSPASSSLHSHA